MLKYLAVAAVAASAFVLNAGDAQTASSAYCLKNSAGPGDCKYASYAQCKAALSGRDGTCERNPDRRGRR